MQFSIKNFLGKTWTNGLKTAIKEEVVDKTDFEFDDYGLQLIDSVIIKLLAPKKLIEDEALT